MNEIGRAEATCTRLTSHAEVPDELMKFLVTRNVVAAILLDATMPQTHSASSNSSMLYAAHHTNCNCDRLGPSRGQAQGGEWHLQRDHEAPDSHVGVDQHAFSSASDAIITSWPVLSALLVPFM